MLLLLSPAKSLDFDAYQTIFEPSVPVFQRESKVLLSILKKKKIKDLQDLMDISLPLAELNSNRYKQMTFPQTELLKTKPAAFAFTGDVYQGLQFQEFSNEDVVFAQEHLRILSGLYGVLKPLDAMQAYRLEMGTSLPNKKGSNLYHYWSDTITKHLNETLRNLDTDFVINLASQEYFSAVNTKKLKAKVISPNFKEYKNGKYVFISFNAKKARGMMAAYILKNRLNNPEEIKSFMDDDYAFNQELSNEKDWIFTRINKTK